MVILSSEGAVKGVAYQAESGITLDFPVWSQKGNELYFTRDGDMSGIWKVAAQPNASPALVLSGSISFPALAPDGLRLAVVNNQDGEYPNLGIILFNLADGTRRRIGAASYYLAWSPDGCYLYYGRAGGEEGIWVQKIEDNAISLNVANQPSLP